MVGEEPVDGLELGSRGARRAGARPNRFALAQACHAAVRNANEEHSGFARVASATACQSTALTWPLMPRQSAGVPTPSRRPRWMERSCDARYARYARCSGTGVRDEHDVRADPARSPTQPVSLRRASPSRYDEVDGRLTRHGCVRRARTIFSTTCQHVRPRGPADADGGAFVVCRNLRLAIGESEALLRSSTASTRGVRRRGAPSAHGRRRARLASDAAGRPGAARRARGRPDTGARGRVDSGRPGAESLVRVGGPETRHREGRRRGVGRRGRHEHAEQRQKSIVQPYWSAHASSRERSASSRSTCRTARASRARSKSATAWQVGS